MSEVALKLPEGHLTQFYKDPLRKTRDYIDTDSPQTGSNPNSNPGKSQRQQQKEGGEEGWEGKEKMRRLPERPEMIQNMKTGLLDLLRSSSTLQMNGSNTLLLSISLNYEYLHQQRHAQVLVLSVVGLMFCNPLHFSCLTCVFSNLYSSCHPNSCYTSTNSNTSHSHALSGQPIRTGCAITPSPAALVSQSRETGDGTVPQLTTLQCFVWTL